MGSSASEPGSLAGSVGSQQSRMTFPEPCDNVIPQPHRQRTHGGRVGIRDEADAFVARDVPLLPKSVERIDRSGLDAERFSKRLDHAEVMLVPRCPIAAGRQRSARGLERGVVRDVHPPVRTQVLSGAVGQVALDDAQQVADLVRARAVRDHPAVPFPVLQAHSSLR